MDRGSELPSKLQITERPQEVTINRHNGVVDIIMPEGIYSIIYGEHYTPQNPNMLPPHMDGISLEGVLILDNDSLDSIMSQNFPYSLENDLQYKNLMPVLEKRRTPIYALDVAVQSNTTSGVLQGFDGLPEISEFIIGGALAVKLLSRRMKRRTFLRAAGAAAATYLTLPVVSDIGMVLSNKLGVGDEISANVAKTTSRLHPEYHLLVAKIRNTLFALKERVIMNELGSNSQIATVLGAAHVGIEDQIAKTFEENLDDLHNLRPVLGIYNHESLYRGYKYEFDGMNWKMTKRYEFPQILQAIS